jgi:hypothetical protein
VCCDAFEWDLEESARRPGRCREVSRGLRKKIETGPETIEAVWVKWSTVNGVVEEQTTRRDLCVENGLSLRVLRSLELECREGDSR